MPDANVSFLTSTTSAQVLEPSIAAGPNVDLIARVTSDKVSGSMNVVWSETEKVLGGLRSWAFRKTREIETLVGVIRWQHRLLDYNAHYNAYLLKQISEREFEKIAASFSYEPGQCDLGELITRISTIIELTEIDYTPSELADLFQCHVDLVTKGLEQVKWPTLLVPAQKTRGNRRK